MRALLVALLLLAPSACAHESPSGLPVVRIDVGGHHLSAEVARSEAEQARGLMYRRKLGRNAGMIFVYEDDRPLNFWMKNTFIPLSIAYIDKDRTIVRILDMKPLTTSTYGSGVPVRYALEANQGWFEKNGIEAGSKVEFELPPAAK